MIYKKKLIKFEENLKLNKCTKFDMEAPRKRNLVSYKEDEKLQSLQKDLEKTNWIFEKKTLHQSM